MRFLPVVAALVLAITSPALAQDSKGHNFGRVDCQSMACPSDMGGAVSNSELASVASLCISKAFAYSRSTPFFDQDMGLDANNCLSPIPNAIPRTGNASMVPSCCVIPHEGSSNCVMHCELNAQ